MSGDVRRLRAPAWPVPDTEPAHLLTAAELAGWPVSDWRCVTCRHPLRPWIELQHSLGTPAATITRMIAAAEVPSPSKESVLGHVRRHVPIPAKVLPPVPVVARSLEEHSDALSELRARWESWVTRGDSAAAAPQAPAGAHADLLPTSS